MADTITLDESRRATPGRASVEVVADELVHDFDEMAIGHEPALAIRDAIREGIQGIGQRASAATVEYRERARAALARGAAWAVKRYAGRRPGQSDRLFNDSGALADLEVEQGRDGAWDVVAPPNRDATPETFTGGAFAEMLERLRRLVPALRDPLSDPRVVRAIEASAARVVRVRR